MAAADTYAEEVHKQLHRYANWFPTDKISVGDVGQLQGKIFTRVSHLSKFGITYNVVDDPTTQATYKFTSSGAKEVAISILASGASGGVGSAGLNIAFSKENSVYFLLSDCVGHSIDDLVDLGQKVLKQVRRGTWQLDWVIVTRVVTAGSATILQADSKGASIELEGDASGKSVADLLKAGGSVKVKSQSSVGLNIVAEKTLTPLLSLAKIKYTFFDKILGSEPTFSYTGGRGSKAIRDFSSHVGSLANADLPGVEEAGNQLSVSVKLPKYGDYVDMADILWMATKTSPVSGRPAVSTGASAIAPTGFRVGSRVSSRRLRTVINKLPFANIDKTSNEGDFMHVNLILPKSGASVSVKPLIKLAMEAAEPRAVATMTANLSLEELL